MDVGFALAALRRYAWVVGLGVAIGVVAATTMGLWTTGLYESRAVLAVRPSTGGNIFFSAPEQYVDSQVIQLRSGSVVEGARQELVAAGGPELSTAEIERMVSIERRPTTEIVAIVTTDDDPDLARAVTEAYVTAYLASLPTMADDEERRAELTTEAAELTDELAVLDEQIAAAMAPFLDAVDGDSPVPAPEAVVPATMSRRQVVQTDLAQVDWALVELDRTSQIQINTTLLDDGSAPPAELPLEPNLTAAGAIGMGAFAGVLGALLAGRLSSRVLDRRMAEELLGAPVVASIGNDEALAAGPAGALGQLASPTQTAIERLCTRAEVAAKEHSLVVAVTSSRRPAGTSTLATAMAARFASWGSVVSLIDADGSDPDLVSVLTAHAPEPVVPPDLSVRSLASADLAPSAQTDDASHTIDAARSDGGTVVIDCGPALGSAPARRSIELADVIVVAVPRREQERAALGEVAEILRRGGQPIIGVMTTIAR